MKVILNKGRELVKMKARFFVLGFLVFICVFGFIGKANAEKIALRVAVWDNTENNPIPFKSEIWVRGVGSKFLKDAPFIAGSYSSGIKYKAYFYPETREGKELIIYFATSVNMNPDGSVRDTLWISFDDEEIQVYGIPIELANEESELIFKRKDLKVVRGRFFESSCEKQQ